MNTTETPEKNQPTQLKKEVLYTAKAHTTGGRDGGASKTSDGRLDVKFSVPGKPGNGTNPEQMLAAGWSSCYLSAILIAAAKKRVKLPADVAIDAEVDLCNGSDGYSLQARFTVSLPGLEREAAQTLAEAAHGLCPYSKALHGSINITTNLA